MVEFFSETICTWGFLLREFLSYERNFLNSYWITQLIFLMFIFEREREREHEQGKSRERGTQRIWSRLCTISAKPNGELEPTDCEIMTWAEVGCSTNWTTQAHQGLFKFSISHWINCGSLYFSRNWSILFKLLTLCV